MAIAPAYILTVRDTVFQWNKQQFVAHLNQLEFFNSDAHCFANVLTKAPEEIDQVLGKIYE